MSVQIPKDDSGPDLDTVLAYIDEPRKVQAGARGSLRLNIPKTAREVHGIEKGDELDVIVVDDGLFIQTSDHE
jgi:hypothetical protein